MVYSANQFQINHLIDLLGQDYLLYAPKLTSQGISYLDISKADEIVWSYKRTIMPFKKILFPDKQTIAKEKRKIAVLGMPLCDIAALNIFLKQFEGSGLIPERDDLLIIGGDCQPDESCFCNQFDLEKHFDFDLFIVKEGNDFLIKNRGWRGKDYIARAALKSSSHDIQLKAKAQAEKFDLALTTKNIDDKTMAHDFWQGIANNCYGCGACSTVCPLCFCFRQDFSSKPDGTDQKCLKWDSCFANEFSQINFGHDLRPENADRLYNWYHHKFIRGPRELGNILCVGCGRCITACPAHLSIRSIIGSLNNKYPE